MKWTPRRTVTSLLILAFALGLALFLASAPSAVAEPVGVTPLPPVEETDGHAGASFSYYPDPQTGSGRPFERIEARRCRNVTIPILAFENRISSAF